MPAVGAFVWLGAAVGTLVLAVGAAGEDVGDVVVGDAVRGGVGSFVGLVVTAGALVGASTGARVGTIPAVGPCVGEAADVGPGEGAEAAVGTAVTVQTPCWLAALWSALHAACDGLNL